MRNTEFEIYESKITTDKNILSWARFLEELKIADWRKTAGVDGNPSMDGDPPLVALFSTLLEAVAGDYAQKLHVTYGERILFTIHI